MSVKKIPANEIVTCDSCCLEINSSADPTRKQNGEILMNQDALDYQGSPCASANIKFDLCDKCLNRLVICINAEIEKIRSQLDIQQSVAETKGKYLP